MNDLSNHELYAIFTFILYLPILNSTPVLQRFQL